MFSDDDIRVEVICPTCGNGGSAPATLVYDMPEHGDTSVPASYSFEPDMAQVEHECSGDPK